jgi:hypothetical protein
MTASDSQFDAAASALSAIENASRIPVGRGDLRPMLSTGAGEPSHLRALFGDVDLHTLLRLAALYGIGDKTLARSYVVARDSVAAANAELDEFAAQFDL